VHKLNLDLTGRCCRQQVHAIDLGLKSTSLAVTAASMSTL
jgi:hypothetical protein